MPESGGNPGLLIGVYTLTLKRLALKVALRFFSYVALIFPQFVGSAFPRERRCFRGLRRRCLFANAVLGRRVWKQPGLVGRATGYRFLLGWRRDDGEALSENRFG